MPCKHLYAMLSLRGHFQFGFLLLVEIFKNVFCVLFRPAICQTLSPTCCKLHSMKTARTLSAKQVIAAV